MMTIHDISLLQRFPTLLTLLILVMAAGSVLPATAQETMSLDQALQAADERNLTLQGVRYELDRSQGQLSRAWGLVIPMVEASASYSHADHEDTMDLTAGLSEMLADAFEGTPIEIPDTGESEPAVVRRQDDASGSLTAVWSILSPSNWSTISVAKQASELTEASVEDTRQELLVATAQAWYAARMTGELVGVAQAQLQSAEHHLEVSRIKLEAGSGLRIDQVRAEADVAAARQDLLDAQLGWENSRDALGMLTGTGGLPIPAAEPALQVPQATDEQLVELALPRRTDLLVSQASVDLTRSQLGGTWAQFAPSVDLVWQGSYQFTEPTDMGSTDRSRWTLMATLTVPLYNHMRYGELHTNRAALRQAEVQLADARWQASAEIRTARRDHETASAAVEIAAQQASLADEALRLSCDAYEVGAGSSLEVTDARRSSVSAEINLATTRLQADLAELALLRALGQDMLTVARP